MSAETGVFAVMYDWVTMASYNFPAYAKAVGMIRSNWPGTWKPKKWLQYNGDQLGEIFHGMAMQSNEKEHYIIKVSGMESDTFLEWFIKTPYADSFYATRIDVQRTIDVPGWWIPRKVADALVNNRHVVTLIESETGSTVYLGNRASGRYVRFYEKKMGSRDYVRLEIELKKEHARNAYQHILDGSSCKSVYGSHLYALGLPGDWENSYMPADRDEIDLKLYKKNVEAEGQLDWLKSLVPKFRAMANDHTVGSRVKDIFWSIALEGEEVSDS